jgi:nifR3 family TIM-barrel protein
MNLGFWGTLKLPIFALAPMADVTDAAFRRIIAKYGKPDVMWTEFVSCDGLCSAGRDRLIPDLWFTDAERPIVAQFFGATPEHFYECAQLAQELGFDGIDINMGCPDRSVEKQGAGAALIKSPALATKIILETKRGAGKLPVSVKTRTGYRENSLRTWLPYLLAAGPAAITMHARTRSEMSLVPARWEAVRETVEIVQKYFGVPERPLVLGNGDIKNIAEAEERVRETGADGVMIGRGIFGNPWLFSLRENNHPEQDQSVGIGQYPTVPERLRVMAEHTALFDKLFGASSLTGRGIKNFDIMKKHYKAYVSGWDGAKELRNELMAAENASEVARIVKARYSKK